MSASICPPQGCKIVPDPNNLWQGHFATDEPDHDTMQAFEKAFGQKIDIELRFINFESGMHFPLQAARTAAANGAPLFIKIEPFSGKRFPQDRFDYLAEINKGTFDDLFRSLGKEIRAFGLPVFLTFGHEMNIEYRGSGAYPWAGLENAEKFKAAYARVHDLISGDASAGNGGANNATWVLNFDARDYKNLDRYLPDPKYFDYVAVDGYVNDNFLPRNLGDPKKVMHNLFDPIFTALAGNPRLKNKPLFVGEFGVSMGLRMTQKRKAELIAAFLEYTQEFNRDPRHPAKICGYVYFDVKKPKSMLGGDTGSWKIDSEEAKKAYKDWLDGHAALFRQPVAVHFNAGTTLPFQGPPAIPIPPAKIDLNRLPAKQLPPGDKDWDRLIPPPLKSVIGKYNRQLGLNLLDRWGLEKYVDRGKDGGEKLMQAGIEAFLQIDPALPLNFSLRTAGDYQEITHLKKSGLPPEIALAPYFENPLAYWENAVTFVSVYSQKAIESQDKAKTAKAAKACELLIARFETQKKLETGLPDKNYSYPSAHNLGLLKLTLADARAQLKILDYKKIVDGTLTDSQIEKIYSDSIDLCLEAIALFQSLEKGEDNRLYPTGADYFSIAKAITSIGDLKVRIAQVHARRLDFKSADKAFREAEQYFQAVANLDAGRGKGLAINIEVFPGKRLRLNIPAAAMLKAWESNLSKGYIRHHDKQRGFQGTFYFIRALASIKTQGAFLENPTKQASDYNIEGLMARLALLQNSLQELVRDPELKVDFLKGLAYIMKANLLIMIGDRAQYDTGTMDRASALEYFNRLGKKLGEIIPEFSPSVSALQSRLEKREKEKAAKPSHLVSVRPLTIDDNLLADKPMLPFAKTAGASKRFALIIANLAISLAEEVGAISRPASGRKEPRYPYLSMLSNLLQADMAVRIFYITEEPLDPKAIVGKVVAAQNQMEEDEDWFRFQAKFLEASTLVLRNSPGGADLDRGIRILDSALEDTRKLIDSSRVFYQAHIYLLQGQACVLRRKFKEARAIVDRLKAMLPKIEALSPEIGWNLKDFKVRYSRLLIRSVNTGSAGIEVFVY